MAWEFSQGRLSVNQSMSQRKRCYNETSICWSRLYFSTKKQLLLLFINHKLDCVDVQWEENRGYNLCLWLSFFFFFSIFKKELNMTLPLFSQLLYCLHFFFFNLFIQYNNFANMAKPKWYTSIQTPPPASRGRQRAAGAYLTSCSGPSPCAPSSPAGSPPCIWSGSTPA